MKDQLLQEARELQDELTTWRHSLHQIPELGLNLPLTTAFVKKELDAMGIPYHEYPECACITAVLGDKAKGKCFLLRSDMDGLPIPEESGEEFSSNNGCMHACGHDLHTSVLLGAAKLLKKHEASLNGVVKLLFQAGEETFEGASLAIEAGVLKNPDVDAAFAMHVASIMSNNTVIYGPYPMSAVYGFRITVNGRGTHGSTPQFGIDPINASAHICLALQELISREVASSEEAVLTIGSFHAGTASNIIPEQAVLEGTLRTFKPELREMLISRIDNVVHSIASAYRTEVKIEVLSNVPPVACDASMNEEIAALIKELDNTIKVLPMYHVMGSEDFAFISERVPSSYFCLGAGVPDKTQWVSQHNPKVRFSDECLPLGAAIYAKTALNWLNMH